MATREQLPTLESGDRLTRDEFHRRYSLRHDIKKAELVFGVVYVGSPVNQDWHGRPHGVMVLWTGNYALARTGVDFTNDSTVRLGRDIEFQPDTALYWDPPRPGGALRDENGFITGPPQLVVEVAYSSASYDLHDKFRAYEKYGVQEYIVWRTEDSALDWFRRSGERFERVLPDQSGMIESSVFPGLRLDVTALLAGDYSRVLAALQPPAS